MGKQIEPMIDEAKVARVMAMMEANIDAEVEAENAGGEYLPGTDIYIVGSRPKTRPKPKLPYPEERTLKAELSIAEQREVGERCKLKAREAWEAGDNFRKVLWGGWR
jgi:hypothetical protein